MTDLTSWTNTRDALRDVIRNASTSVERDTGNTILAELEAAGQAYDQSGVIVGYSTSVSSGLAVVHISQFDPKVFAYAVHILQCAADELAYTPSPAWGALSASLANVPQLVAREEELRRNTSYDSHPFSQAVAVPAVRAVLGMTGTIRRTFAQQPVSGTPQAIIISEITPAMQTAIDDLQAAIQLAVDFVECSEAA